MASKTYQDQWLNGHVAVKGYRECANRYEIIRSFCNQFQGPFTVCDIGANMCYFGLRLTEDFPECRVMAFEFDHFQQRIAHVKRNTDRSILLLNRKLNLNDLDILAECCTFDVVLCLSILHHFHIPHELDSWLMALRNLGRNIIVEFAAQDSRMKLPDNYQVPPDAILLGNGISHLKPDIKRPIVLIPGIAK